MSLHLCESVVSALDGYMEAQKKWQAVQDDPRFQTGWIDRFARDVTDARRRLILSLDRLARGKDDPAP